MFEDHGTSSDSRIFATGGIFREGVISDGGITLASGIGLGVKAPKALLPEAVVVLVIANQPNPESLDPVVILWPA